MRVVSDISRKVFWPEPNVDSALVEIKRKPDINLQNQKIFFKVVESAFSQRRKMLKSTLKGLGLEDLQLKELFEKTGISQQMRAEQLSVTDYQRISEQVALILDRS